MESKTEEQKILGMSAGEVFKYAVVVLVSMSSTYLAIEKKIDANVNDLDQNKILLSDIRADLKQYPSITTDLEKRIHSNGVKLNEINKSIEEIKDEMKWKRRRTKR